ncbi:MAG: SH3 domain-containing protein [Anaerolineales bacterium]
MTSNPIRKPAGRAHFARSLGIGAFITLLLSFGGCLAEPRAERPNQAPTKTPNPYNISSGIQGALSFPYLAADAGNFSLQAGDEITITWIDAPDDARAYEIRFIAADGTVESMSLLGDPAAGEVWAHWLVPPRMSGELEGRAQYSDGHWVRSGCCAHIYTGDLPPEGICSLRTRGLEPQHLYRDRDEHSERLVGVAPGMYMQVLERSPGGWYRVRVPPAAADGTIDPSSTTGWVKGWNGVSLLGPCDDIPVVHPPGEKERSTLSPGWDEIQDPISGVRIAIPCFWQAEFQNPENSGRASLTSSLRNYSPFALDFTLEEDIFDAGAIEIKLVHTRRAVPGRTAFERLEAFANTTAADPSDGKTIAVHAHHLNGQPAIQVDYENEFGSGRYTIFELPDGAFLLFIPNPAAADRPDVLAIRDSITVSPDSIMNIPQIKPAAPPFEEDASCLWGDLELRSPQASGG